MAVSSTDDGTTKNCNVAPPLLLVVVCWNHHNYYCCWHWGALPSSTKHTDRTRRCDPRAKRNEEEIIMMTTRLVFVCEFSSEARQNYTCRSKAEKGNIPRVWLRTYYLSFLTLYSHFMHVVFHLSQLLFIWLRYNMVHHLMCTHYKCVSVCASHHTAKRML